MTKKLEQTSFDLGGLFASNKLWAKRMEQQTPGFFQQLSKQQAPEYLWIGCSDSRVPANEIVDLLPGELFVHRNVANVVVHSDLNCLSVLQYAIDILQVKHILVVGHYGCGGIRAVHNGKRFGLVDNWLRHVQDVQYQYNNHLEAIKDDELRFIRLCELNVISQVANLCQTTVVQDAWQRGQQLNIHGWVYALEDGLVRNLNMDINGLDQWQQRVTNAVQRLQPGMQPV